MATVRDVSPQLDVADGVLRLTYSVRHERHEAGRWFTCVIAVDGARATKRATLESHHQAPVEIEGLVDMQFRCPDITVAGWRRPLKIVVACEPLEPSPSEPVEVSAK